MAVSTKIMFYEILQILRDYSDEENILSRDELINKLNERIGKKIDRRTLYKYIKDLKQLGINICSYEENGRGYYIREHKLEEYEIKLLLDCITANKSITAEKTLYLSNKLCGLHNLYVKYGLNRQVFIGNRAKSSNNEVHKNIEIINQAIKEEKKISFNYSDYNESKELIVKFANGKPKVYIANPIAMILKDDYYYLIMNYDKYDDMSHYRIDKIKGVQLLDEDRKDLELIEGCGLNFDPSSYAKKCIKMFIGKERLIELEVRGWAFGFLIDELGKDIKVTDFNGEWYKVIISCIYGDGLVSWLLGMGKDVKVISPVELREKVINETQKILELY